MDNSINPLSPAFRKLLRHRLTVRFSLSIMVFLCYAFFVGGIVFYQDFFARPVSSDATLTVGIICAVLVLLAMMVLEYIYIVISDKFFDPLQAAVSNEGTTDV